MPGGPGSRRHPALRVIEMLWTDFGYPDEIRNLIGFVPAEPGELIGTEAIECRWRDYVERVRARIPEAGSSRVIADLDEIGDPSGWLHQGGTGGGLPQGVPIKGDSRWSGADEVVHREHLARGGP